MLKFIKKLFHKTPTIGQMRTELKIYGMDPSDKVFSTLTYGELKMLLRKSRRAWRKFKVVADFIESRENAIKRKEQQRAQF